MPALTNDEIQNFLDEPGQLVRLATVDHDGMPRVLPLWFVVRDEQLLFTPRQPSLIWRNLQSDPRVGASIDEERHPWRKVTLQGQVQVVHPPGDDALWRPLYREIARRYVSDAAADHYVDGTDDQPRALCSIDLKAASTRLTTWRMPVAGEDVRGVWHRRYYAPGTKWGSDLQG